MILSKERDPRFITIRRGGTLTDADHHHLALWGALCAEHVLHLFESTQPADERPRQAIEQVRAWVRGEITMTESRAAGDHAMAAAMDLRGAARQIAGIAGIALLIFTAVLGAFLQERTGTNRAFSYTMLGAGIAAATVSLIQAGLQEALINQTVLATQGESLRLLLVMIGSLDTFKLLALALLSATTSALLLQARLLPRWLGWLGILYLRRADVTPMQEWPKQLI